MTLLKKILLYASLFGLVFINTTCTKKMWFDRVIYSGYVYDTRSSGKPVSGVSVILYAAAPGVGGDGHASPAFVVGQCVTDASGHFYIHERAARSGRYCPQIDGNQLSNNCYVRIEELSHDEYAKVYLR